MDSDKMELDYELMEQNKGLNNKIYFNNKKNPFITNNKNPFMTYKKNPFLDNKKPKKKNGNKMDLDD